MGYSEFILTVDAASIIILLVMVLSLCSAVHFKGANSYTTPIIAPTTASTAPIISPTLLVGLSIWGILYAILLTPKN